MPDRRKRGGGRAARKAERTSSVIKGVPYITRKVPFYEVLNDEGLTLIENNAETILQEIGVEFRGDQEALDLWKSAGADIDGERGSFGRMCACVMEVVVVLRFCMGRILERGVWAAPS